MQTNGWHWVLDETHARQAHAVVGFRASMQCHLLRSIENVEKTSDTNGLQMISKADATISRADQSSVDNGPPVLSVQLVTPLLLGNRCMAAMVDPDEWLTILISTLPDKGEESLDLQSPLTASEP